MKKIFTVVIIVMLAQLSVFAQGKNITATNFGGSISAPAGSITTVMGTNITATTRSIHMQTNSPAPMVVMALPSKFPMTNSSWTTYVTSGYGTNYVTTTNTITDTMSYATFTNELVVIAGGASTNGPLATFTIAPGDFLKWDGSDMSQGPIIVMPIGSTNALFEVKDGK